MSPEQIPQQENLEQLLAEYKATSQKFFADQEKMEQALGDYHAEQTDEKKTALQSAIDGLRNTERELGVLLGKIESQGK